MNVPIKVVLDMKELERIAAVLPGKTDEAIRNLAFRLEAEAKTIPPHIDTGCLMTSIFVKTSKGSNFGQRAAAAKAKYKQKYPDRDIQIVDDLPEASEGYAVVGSGVEYALWQEVKENGGKPYMTPAAEKVGNDVNSGKVWEGLFKR